MIGRFLIVIFFVTAGHTALGQSFYAVKGRVVDGTNNLPVVNSTIAILNAHDSTLCTFIWNKSDAFFEIEGLRPGSFFVIVSYPGYEDYIHPFQLDSLKREHDLGIISLNSRTKLLPEVIVKGRAIPLKIVGDTTEYSAAAFSTQLNAKVEDLLRQFPGIRLDQNGGIVAQGKRVEKILLDGKEFFSDDPTLVTQNVRADMVDKVQVYEGASSPAIATAIDKSQKTKTINIKLREDKKNGYFGNGSLGGGTDAFYRGQLMANYFQKKRRTSIFGSLGNTGKVGFGSNETGKYGISGAGLLFSDEGDVFIFSNSVDELETFDGRYRGEGLPVSRLGGVHFDTKIGDDKGTANVNYKIGSLDLSGSHTSIYQDNLPNSFINTYKDQTFDNRSLRQRLDGVVSFSVDSMSDVRIGFDGTLKNTNSLKIYSTKSSRIDSSILYDNNRTVDNDMIDNILGVYALYTRKFRKPARLFTLKLGEASTYLKSEERLNSNTNFYNTKNELDSLSNTNQWKRNSSAVNYFNLNAAYSEPISSRLTVLVNYGLITGVSIAEKLTYNVLQNGTSNDLDSLLSNKFKLTQIANQAGLIFSYKLHNYSFNLGGKFSAISFKHDDRYSNVQLRKDFLNLYPKALVTYSFGSTGSVSLRYDRYGFLPTIAQIQPVVNNVDPLNLTVGNVNLKPSFSNTVVLLYSGYKVSTGRMIWINATYSMISSPIVSNKVIDLAGISTYSWANIRKRGVNLNLTGVVERNFSDFDMNFGAVSGIVGSVYYNLVNYKLNKSTAYNFSEEITFSKTKTEKYSFNGSIGPFYDVLTTSFNKNNSNGWGIAANTSMIFYLPHNFDISSDINFKYRSATQSFNNDFSRLLLNLSVSKRLLKGENVRIGLSANDLLDQNLGFDRMATGSLISQDKYTIIRRYFMLSATWDFSKMNGNK